MKKILLLALCVFGSSLVAAPAAVFYSQTFDGLASGNINGQVDNGPLAPSSAWGGNTGAGFEDVVQSTVAYGGQALLVNNGGTGVGQVYRFNIFDSIANRPTEIMQFDIRLEDTVAGFSTPGLDLQQTLLFRGPAVNKQFAFVYKGTLDGGGGVFQDRFELRGGSNPLIGSPTAPNATDWYRVRMDIDWVNATIDMVISNLTTSTVFWDPAERTSAFDINGNVNVLSWTNDNSPHVGFYIDNLTVGIPEPSTMLLFVTGAGLLWAWRRRG